MKAIVAGLAAAILNAAPAEAQQKMVMVYGTGLVSCATAMKQEYRDSSMGWLLGYVSGRNINASKQLLNTDANGIIGEVELYCKENPSETFLAASAFVYNKLTNRN